MNTLLALVRREARDSRPALVTAPLVSAAVLGAVQFYFAKPYEVADAAAIASALLIALWTLYFSADAFAGDFASGRMATKALLPVRAWELWSAKLAFVALAVLALSAWTLGLAYALQWTCGGAVSVSQLEAGLVHLASLALPLILLSSAALLCSLLVDSALAATLLALLIVGALRAASLALEPLLHSVGPAWLIAHEFWASPLVAALFLAVGAAAFVRGQRRFGARRTRVLVTVAILAIVVSVGGVASAASLYRRLAVPEVQLRSRGVEFRAGAPSPDGRFLALLAGWTPVGGSWQPPAVFVLDVESGHVERLAGHGSLGIDRHVGFPLPWEDERSLIFTSFNPFLVDARDVRATFDGSGWSTETALDGAATGSRLVPTWADVEYHPAEQPSERFTSVRWKKRGLETRFRASGTDSIHPGSGVLAAPEPGRVLRAAEGRLLLLDMSSGEERCLLDGGVARLRPSPDGAAVIVDTQDSTHVLLASDGKPLHAPWPRTKVMHGRNVEYRGGVAWVSGGQHHRTVEVFGFDSGQVHHVLDLASGTTIDLPRDARRSNLYRLADRGYVYVGADDDLVWVDLDGKLVKVLVDR